MASDWKGAATAGVEAPGDGSALNAKEVTVRVEESATKTHLLGDLVSGGGGKGSKDASQYAHVDLGSEFGGPWGAFALMLFSHVVVYALLLTADYDVHLGWYKNESFKNWGDRVFGAWVDYAEPTWEGFCLYFGFVIYTAVLAVVVPGIKMKGLPLPSLGGVALEYVCNGVGVWYGTIIGLLILQFSGAVKLSAWADNLGSVCTWALLTGDFISVWLWAWCKWVSKNEERATGHAFYDIFMGTCLNPRITLIPGFPQLDLKMWAELRVPWILLFVITSSCAAKEYELTDTVSAPMAFMVLAHWFYGNACSKGDHCVPTTWDIFYEKWGWMLIFWNMCGVPITYCTSSLYLLRYPVTRGEGDSLEHHPAYTAFVYILLILAYYLWDTANSQKNHFRMKLAGTFVQRWTFPQLPWGTLKDDAKCIDTARGSKLLVDGWYGYMRKPHYTGDIIMALTWGLICGFGAFVPYWYFIFFTGMIIHRTGRDQARCKTKYGADWDTYTKTVPYIFIYGII